MGCGNDLSPGGTLPEDGNHDLNQSRMEVGYGLVEQDHWWAVWMVQDGKKPEKLKDTVGELACFEGFRETGFVPIKASMGVCNDTNFEAVEGWKCKLEIVRYHLKQFRVSLLDLKEADAELVAID